MDKRFRAAAFCLFFSGCALLDRSGIPAALPRYSSHPNEYRGVFHVHTQYSHDSELTLREIVTAARKSKLDFVIVTDHNSIDAAAAYHRGALPAPPLMIFGVENTTPDGHLITLGPEEAPPPGLSSEAILKWAHKKEGFGILAHPVARKNPWKNQELRDFDGLEVYNFMNSLFDAGKLSLAGRLGMDSKKGFLKNFQKRPDASLDYWDKKLESGKYSGWGALDAHIHHKWLGWPLENERLQFQSVTLVAIADRLERKPVLEALAKGRSFIAFESRGIATGFSFTAEAKGKIYRSGETTALRERPVFLIKTPERARIVLVNHGAVVFEYEGKAAAYPVDRRGVYRVEVYRGRGLWILSNPIYIE